MLHTNNEIDRAYYFTILRTPWGEQMEDGLLCNSMGRIVDRTGMLEKLLSGNDEYTSYLQNIVKDAGADDYIHFKGRCNLEKIYPHYELFASFSLWETFGLSLMEAVGDGLAMVGLDVRYGNRLFIHPDEMAIWWILILKQTIKIKISSVKELQQQ